MMVAIKEECPKCNAEKLYVARYSDGTDRYCPICGYRRTFDVYERVQRTPRPAMESVSKNLPRQSREKIYVRECTRCGDYFEALSPAAIYCTASCRQTAYKDRLREREAAG